jgi:hypothetical protein
MKIHKHKFYDLAVAIIKQWQLDGKPKGDTEGVKIWADLVAAHQDQMYHDGIKRGDLSY